MEEMYVNHIESKTMEEMYVALWRMMHNDLVISACWREDETSEMGRRNGQRKWCEQINSRQFRQKSLQPSSLVSFDRRNI